MNADYFLNDKAKISYIEGRLGGTVAELFFSYLTYNTPHRINTSTKLVDYLRN